MAAQTIGLISLMGHACHRPVASLHFCSQFITNGTGMLDFKS